MLFKVKRPNVRYKNTIQGISLRIIKVYIEGTLSFDAVVFKQLIVDMAQCLAENMMRPKYEKLHAALIISKASTWQGIDSI